MTDRMEELAYAYFRKIDELGGMVEAVKQAFPQREIADASFALQQEIDREDRTVVGVNRFVDREEAPIEILHVDPALERKQVGRLRAMRAGRDTEAVERVLTELRETAAQPDRNLMPALLECARAHATEGEIVEALQAVFGTYREAPIF
jgi:methylmalonyl-CoA mutase, N-terminal domain